MARPFCPDCGNETLRASPAGTKCETCGWQGDLWAGHRQMAEDQEAEIALLRQRGRRLVEHVENAAKREGVDPPLEAKMLRQVIEHAE